MKRTIKLMLLAAVGGALLAAPASAQPNHRRAAHTFQYSPAPGVFQNDTVNLSATPIRTFAAKSSRTTANTTATSTNKLSTSSSED
jgi:hypothetical protein